MLRPLVGVVLVGGGAPLVGCPQVFVPADMVSVDISPIGLNEFFLCSPGFDNLALPLAAFGLRGPVPAVLDVD